MKIPLVSPSPASFIAVSQFHGFHVAVKLSCKPSEGRDPALYIFSVSLAQRNTQCLLFPELIITSFTGFEK